MSPLDAFREALLAAPELQARLAAIDGAEGFASAAVELAASHGIVLEAASLAILLRPDPLGVSRLVEVAPSRGWAPPGWLPVDIVPTAGGAAVDWAYFGDSRLDEPFFAGSVRRAIVRPINRLLRWQTPLDHFVAAAEPAPAPQGLIFHWSRCGSTLVSRMIGRLPGVTAISEALPLDAAVHFGDAALLRAMAAALGRRGERTILKLNAWHATRMDLYRAAFPETPWIFLHRDPLEILASHAGSPAPEMMPPLMPPALFGLDPESPPGPDYAARVLARIAEAAIEAAGGGGGLFVDYPALPAAVDASILPHFGLASGMAEQAAMAAAASDHAKRPGTPFTPDGVSKRDGASPEQREAVALHLATLRARLLALS